METNDRRLKIFELLYINKKVSVNELANLFDVSNMTIRRDLSLMEKQGILTCVYGGAILNKGVSNEASFELKNNQSLENKVAIGYYASQLVDNSETIYLDCGTTIYNMARFLTNKKITVVTNSWPLIDLFKANEKVELIMAPGKYNTIDNGVASSLTINFLKGIHVDKAFISCQGFDLNKGPCNPNEIDNAVKETSLQIANENYLLIDHNKLNEKCTYYFEKPSRIQNVIIDENVSKAELNKIKNIIKNVKIAPSFKKNIKNSKKQH